MNATLLTDGSSDTVLVPILAWLLARLTPEPWDVRWADLRGLPNPPRVLRERVLKAVDLFPCSLVFVHRDAERQAPKTRYAEIQRAVGELPWVGVVPVRMQETWLLHDEAALRRAAGRPTGNAPLSLPNWTNAEKVARPKQVLHQALLVAAEVTGRRARGFNPDRVAHRVAAEIDDWSPLRQLAAFQRLEADTRAALAALDLPLHPQDT